MKFFETKFFRGFSLITIGLASIALRIYEISNWKLYSDSFKFLLIGKAVYLGKNVITLYPQSDFGTFTSVYTLYKWLYGILIGLSARLVGLAGVTVNNGLFELLAHVWVIVPSVLCVVFVGLVVYEITKSKQFGFIASLLLAFSGTTIIWNSFIVTEPITIFLFLLMIYLDLKYGNLFFNLVVGFLVCLARPEFYFAVPIYIVLSFILRHYLFRDVSKKILHWIDRVLYLIMGVTYVYVFLFSNLFKTNLYGDLFLFVSTLVICIHAIMNKHEGEVDVMGLNSDPMWLVISKFNWVLLVLITFLTLVYYSFNSEIERYVVILIPLLIMLNVNYYFLILKMINWKLVSVLLTFIVMMQLGYVLTFPKYTDVDYHTELSRSVLDYAKANGISNIYVAQSDPEVYENSDENVHIYKLSNDIFGIIQPNSLIIKDD